MEEVMTDLALSIKIDNALLLEELGDNSYHFENEEEFDIWVDKMIRENRYKGLITSYTKKKK